MKKSIFIITILIVACCVSCSRKMESPQMVKKLQKHIDSLTEQGYHIDRVNIYSKSFSNHGASASGQMEFLFISAASPDSTIPYLANFSIQDMASTAGLTFHGYPTDPNNKRKSNPYPPNPRFSEALSKLDEIKKQIPEHYTYQNLLQLDYVVQTDGQSMYEFRIEVKPDSEEATHPKVKKETLSHVTIKRPPRKRKFGYREPKRVVEKSVQYSVRFRLADHQITLK